jgi:uncharacterized membrane protein
MTIQQIRDGRFRNEEPWQETRSRSYNNRERQGEQRGRSTGTNPETLARALGWLSLGLGIAQLAAPRTVADWVGVRHNRNSKALIRTVGLRELASGIGLLTQTRPVGWVQARIGGDAMDLALLGAALLADDTEKDRVAVAMAAVAGIAIADLMSSNHFHGEPFGRRLGTRAGGAAAGEPRGIHVKQTITINRPAQDLYAFWRDFNNLPRLMSHLESVQVLDDRRSHWQAKGPAGMSVEWDAEIVDDQPNQEIAWRSLEGADVANRGSVRFQRAAGDRGTVVSVEFQYDPPGGKLGAAIAKLFGEEPEQQVADDLRAFKQVMETGEVVRSDGRLHGASLGMRPAQPPRPDEYHSSQNQGN